MSLIGTRIPPRFRNALFLVLSISWCTGLLFFTMSRWFTIEGDFGPEPHPWQQPLLKIHGAAAFFMLMAFGALLVSHLPAAWRTRRSRWLGLSLIGCLSFMALTGWSLYYVASEVVRPWLANLHALVGSLIPVLLVAHMLRGRFSRKKRARIKVVSD